MTSQPTSVHAPNIDETSAHVTATAAVLGLEIRPAWHPNVVRFVDVARGMARIVGDGAALPGDASRPLITGRPTR